MRALAGGSNNWKEDFAHEEGNDFQEHGFLRLIPSGFPLKDPGLADQIVSYLGS